MNDIEKQVLAGLQAKGYTVSVQPPGSFARGPRACSLSGGLGNRINGILNHAGSHKNVSFHWPIEPTTCGAHWFDLFKNYLPMATEHECRERNRARFDYLLGVDTDVRLPHMQTFLKALAPSNAVKARMVTIPKGTVGYHVRALSPHSYLRGQTVALPDGVFMACDSLKQRCRSGNTLQTTGPFSAIRDSDRDADLMISAAADWFCLMQCSRIVHVGTSVELGNFQHSTFLDAHQVLGIPEIGRWIPVA